LSPGVLSFTKGMGERLSSGPHITSGTITEFRSVFVYGLLRTSDPALTILTSRDGMRCTVYISCEKVLCEVLDLVVEDLERWCRIAYPSEEVQPRVTIHCGPGADVVKFSFCTRCVVEHGPLRLPDKTAPRCTCEKHRPSHRPGGPRKRKKHTPTPTPTRTAAGRTRSGVAFNKTPAPLAAGFTCTGDTKTAEEYPPSPTEEKGDKGEATRGSPENGTATEEKGGKGEAPRDSPDNVTATEEKDGKGEAPLDSAEESVENVTAEEKFKTPTLPGVEVLEGEECSPGYCDHAECQASYRQRELDGLWCGPTSVLRDAFNSQWLCYEHYQTAPGCVQDPQGLREREREDTPRLSTPQDANDSHPLCNDSHQ
jgi:hypothetical protein